MDKGLRWREAGIRRCRRNSGEKISYSCSPLLRKFPFLSAAKEKNIGKIHRVLLDFGNKVRTVTCAPQDVCFFERSQAPLDRMR